MDRLETERKISGNTSGKGAHTAPSAEGRMAALDGWRGIAILGVLACHGLGTYFPGTSLPQDIFSRILAQGHHGVRLFFGISGFLICTRLLEAEEVLGKIDFKRFYVRRVFRILPIFFLFLFVVALLMGFSDLNLSRRAWLSSVLLIQSYTIKSQEANWYIAHLWSLAVEEHFYFLFPAFLALTGKGSWRRPVSLLVWALLIVVWRSIEFKHHFLWRVLPDIGFFQRTDICLDFLIVPAAVAVIWRSKGLLEGVKNLIRWKYSGIILIGLYFLVVATDPHLSLFLEALIIPLGIVATLGGSTPLVSFVLGLPLLGWIGRISYSLYIWNQLFLSPFLEPKISALAWVEKPPLSFAVLLGVSCLSYYGIEQPLIRLGHRLTSRRAT